MATGSSKEADREVLADFFRLTGGNKWKRQEGWQGNIHDLGSCSGVETNDEKRVIRLELQGYNIVGVIPSVMGRLGALQSLVLTNNMLKGKIPRELGELSAVVTLNLSYNQLTGDIPIELCRLRTLKYLDLRCNQLNGGIPSEISSLGALEDLNLNKNKLRGAIPAELNHLPSITHLDLESNQLTDLGEAEHALKLVAKFNSDGRYGFSRHSKVVRLRNNPWRMPPEAVVEQGLDAINAFLADVQKAKAAGGRIKSLQLLKVVLIGSSAAGKTRALTKELPPEQKEPQTRLAL